MSNFVKTVMAEKARAMCEVTMAAPRYSRLGQLTGDPGTGKTSTTLWLEQELDAIRVEAWSGMKDKTCLQELARAMNNKGFSIDDTGTSNTLMHRIIRGGIEGKLIIVDEANHLKWATLEMLRSISDIGGAALVIAGTDLLAKKFTHPQIRVFLEQYRQRVGTKKVVMQPVKDAGELAAYVLGPRFGAVTKSSADAFMRKTGGNWRFSVALADACTRLMKNEGLTKLDEKVVETAAAWMAGQA
ncbi:ATP-binding protein [Thalassobius sp. I31.1]|uniref:ATP-binding protein n=1 Tax=Thalassobius sp. I31.1 TaxID=2109912 RepID=UPI000D1BC882|nr:ATP-binding protein [Thalassobius sp. I31.1]